MKQLTEIKCIRFSKDQIQTLEKLKDFDVDVPNFIRLAIKEKIKRDWKKIKEQKDKSEVPF